MTYVIDASIAVKWLVKEPLHEAAMTLIDERIALHAPSLILAEIGNTLWKKVRRGEISEDHVRQVGGQIVAYFDSLHSTEDLAERALELALRLDHPVDDCFYLACVEDLGMPLVTADRGLLSAVQATPFAAQIIHIADLVAPKA
jgi:predicted nucleic acid-binding protein